MISCSYRSDDSTRFAHFSIDEGRNKIEVVGSHVVREYIRIVESPGPEVRVDVAQSGAWHR